jgi:hypothetical protein
MIKLIAKYAVCVYVGAIFGIAFDSLLSSFLHILVFSILLVARDEVFIIDARKKGES